MSEHAPNFLTCPIEPPKSEGDNPFDDASTAQPESSEVAWEAPAPPPPPPKKRIFRWRWLVLGLVCAGLIAGLPSGIKVVKAGRSLYSAKSALDQAQKDLSDLHIEDASVQVAVAERELGQARDGLRSLGFWRDLPFIGTQVRALESAADAGSSVLDSTHDILEVAAVVMEALQGGTSLETSTKLGISPTRRFADLTLDEKRDLLRRFRDELPRMRLARDKMQLALELWKRVPQSDLAPPLRSVLRPLAETLPVLQRALDEAVPLIELFVPLVGYPEPQRYLIALQNAEEIRGGGGFIGNVGTITLDTAELLEFSFEDVYAIDNPISGVWKEDPPEPIRIWLEQKKWFMRDANWSPDFPTSAEKVLDFYTRETQLQGGSTTSPPMTYIALEPGFFASLLKLTGPIAVDGRTYTSEDFFEQLEFQVEIEWHQKGLPVTQRKEIIGKIGEEIVKKVFALPASRWPELLDLVTQAAERKQIMLYSRDPKLMALFEERGWTARTQPTRGDFMWVVDSNMAALKTDGAMDKSVTYRLDARDPKNSKATVTLRYTNTAKSVTWNRTRYRSYTRVYVPEGSELLSSRGAMKDDLLRTKGQVVPGKVDVYKDLGKTVFGAFWAIEPGKTGELSFTYRLPASVGDQLAQGKYDMDWLKQIGVDQAKFFIQAQFPRKLLTAEPAEERSHWGDARYDVSADSLTDRSFSVTF